MRNIEKNRSQAKIYAHSLFVYVFFFSSFGAILDLSLNVTLCALRCLQHAAPFARKVLSILFSALHVRT